MTALDMLAAVARFRHVPLTVEIDPSEGDVWTATLGAEHAGGLSCEEAVTNLAIRLIARSVLSTPPEQS